MCAVRRNEKIRKSLESSKINSFSEALEVSKSESKTLDKDIGAVMAQGIEEILNANEAPKIVSVIEWQFEEMNWKLSQIKDILKSIDESLKTPNSTQANEWREIGEKLRHRGLAPKSLGFLLRSIKTNPLDYRTYISLGKTSLQLGNIEIARRWWEKSLAHAPKGEIDYKSYSHRLIGRTYFCEKKYNEAADVLKKAIELSPNYSLAHYDYAQYCALIGNKDGYSNSLKIAMELEREALERQKQIEKSRKKRDKFRELRRKLRDMGKNYKGHGNPVSWTEGTNVILMKRPSAGGWFNWYELVLEEKDNGIELRCTKEASEKFLVKATDLGFHNYNESRKEYNFSTFIDVDDITDGDLAKYFEYFAGFGGTTAEKKKKLTKWPLP